MNAPVKGAEPILRVERACKTYGTLKALNEVSFELQKGEVLAVVGEVGLGQVHGRQGDRAADRGGFGKGALEGHGPLRHGPRDLYAMRRDIQMVFQDPTQSLNPRMSIFQIISEAWVIHPDILPKARWRERVAELLDQVGLSPEHAQRYPHQFSGGQRQRIAIARALALEPEMIIADEAVSALDVSIQAQVIELLDKLKRELGIAFMFIAHDLPVVRDFADHVMVMEKGQVVEIGTVRADLRDARSSPTPAACSPPASTPTRRSRRPAGSPSPETVKMDAKAPGSRIGREHDV